jgi:hypothetical protein
VQPSGDAAAHQLMEQSFPLFHGQPQVPGQLGVMGCLPGVDKVLHRSVVRLVEHD